MRKLVSLKIGNEGERDSHPSLRFSSLKCLGMWSKDLASGEQKHLRAMVLLVGWTRDAEKSLEPWRKVDFWSPREGPTCPDARGSSMVDEGRAESGQSSEVAIEREERDFTAFGALQCKKYVVLFPCCYMAWASRVHDALRQGNYKTILQI